MELLTENILAEVALLWYFLIPVAWVVAVVGRHRTVPPGWLEPADELIDSRA